MTARDEGQDDRDGNQDDDDPLEDLHTPADHLIRDLLSRLLGSTCLRLVNFGMVQFWL